MLHLQCFTTIGDTILISFSDIDLIVIDPIIDLIIAIVFVHKFSENQESQERKQEMVELIGVVI